jgi:hypothetical protein
LKKKVVVIGSGLSAIGAIRALVELGYKPIVIDVALGLDPSLAKKMDLLSRKKPVDWSDEERRSLSENPSASNEKGIPRKLLFGSDFFYGDSSIDAPIIADGDMPPFSYAKGGLSEAWGAASLPPSDSDLDDWPEEARNMDIYISKLLENLPYSAVDDGISLDFPILNSRPAALKNSAADSVILSTLERRVKLEKGRFLFGQARLLVYSGDSISSERSCKYCGNCMGGCVFGSIYKASSEIDELIKNNLIDYLPGSLVDEVKEDGDSVTVFYYNDEHRLSVSADKVYLAAGAVNSTRIVMNSRKSKRSVRLKSRGGYLVPLFSFKTLPISWPETNTQPGVFLELNGGFLKKWVHVQVSSENELFYARLRFNGKENGLIGRVKGFLLSHVAIAFVNFHSDYGPEYELTRTENTSEKPILLSRKIAASGYRRNALVSVMRLAVKLIPCGLVPMFPVLVENGGSYHVGGTLPMKEHPSEEFETDVLGRLSCWKNIHVVDTSTFPSLPGTSIGLATMANAMRIVFSSFKSENDLST